MRWDGMGRDEKRWGEVRYSRKKRRKEKTNR